MPDPKELFDAHYYEHCCCTPYERNEDWLSHFGRIAKHISKDIGPSSVLDAGCAMGFLVEILRDQGTEAWGMDISQYAIGKVAARVKPYCWVGSVADPLPGKYDLIVSIEVLEHLPEPEAEKAVANLCQFTDDILFSSSPDDTQEETHFNVRPPGYWAECFAKQGFFRDVDFDATFITPWAIRFRRNNAPVHRIIRDYERKYWMLCKENTDLEQQVRDVERLRNFITRLRNTPFWRVIRRVVGAGG